MKRLKHRLKNLSFLISLVLAITSCNTSNEGDTKEEQASSEPGRPVPGNPYLPLWEHLPDGEPRVFEDPDNPGKYRIYVIGSHDVRYDTYCGFDTRAWSAPVEDLSDWRDEGVLFSYESDGRWDNLYAPDLVEVIGKDQTKEYYLYPHSRGPNREAMVAKGTRPDGPFTPINLSADGRKTMPGSVMGFDPAVYIEYIDDQKDPDYETGYRVYGYWGFRRSLACQLDPATKYSVRPGNQINDYFIPAGQRYGVIKDPEGTQYPHVFPGEDLGAFNFFEAASIRKIGNKYLWVYSGYSGPEYGLTSANATLRYAYGDTPLGPWKSGGVLVDARAPLPNEDGSVLEATYSGHNTHGSVESINDQWYVFYHRAPRSFGYARQAMVAPVNIAWDKETVANGGRVVITAYDPNANDQTWTAQDKMGITYTGAEVTSEGFNIYGLPPYQYYSAGYACYLTNPGSQQDSWDIWDNHMAITDVKNGDIIGYKYFGFGGLNEQTKGLKPFEGTQKGNNTKFNLFVKSKTSCKIHVWLDGPWENDLWKGSKLGTIEITGDDSGEVSQYTLDVSSKVDQLEGKHAIFLVAEGPESAGLIDLVGLGFSGEQQEIERPEIPEVSLTIAGVSLDVPSHPVRATPENGITDYSRYRLTYQLDAKTTAIPQVGASTNHKDVKISILQADENTSRASVQFDYQGRVKTYEIVFTNERD